MRMFVSLGSNIDPERNLGRAVAELAARFKLVAASRVYRTAPVGDAEQADFWNLAAELDCDLAPPEVQRVLRAVESQLGRTRDPKRKYGPRTIDLDLVLVDGVAGRFGELELPSPLVEREAFVAVPLAGLAPGLRHPVSGRTLGEIALAAATRAPRPPEPLAVELGR